MASPTSPRTIASTATDQGPDVKLSAFNLALASLRLRKPGENEDFLRAKMAQIQDASVDLRRLALSVGQFSTRDGFLNIIREQDGTLNADAHPAGTQGGCYRRPAGNALAGHAEPHRRAEMEDRVHRPDPAASRCASWPTT